MVLWCCPFGLGAIAPPSCKADLSAPSRLTFALSGWNIALYQVAKQAALPRLAFAK